MTRTTGGLFLNSLAGYVISIVLHVVFIGLFVLSERGWFHQLPQNNDTAMIIDLVNAPEISSESTIAKNLVRTSSDAAPATKVAKEEKPKIEGDTKLLSKDEKIYATPEHTPAVSDEEVASEPIPPLDSSEQEEDTPPELPVESTPKSSNESLPEKQTEKQETPTEEKPGDKIKEDTTDSVKVEAVKVEERQEDAVVITSQKTNVIQEKAIVKTTENSPIQPKSKPKMDTPPVWKQKPEIIQPALPPIPRPRQDNKKYEQVLQTVKQYRHEGATTKENISEAAQKSQNSISDADAKMAEHLMQYIYNRLVQCWDVPVAASEASVKVEMEARLNHAGHITEVTIIHKMHGDPIYDVVESSAIRAIKTCSPLVGLPAEKYYLWNRINLVFDPKKLKMG